MKLIIAILWLILSHTALSESISEQDRKFFVEESSLGCCGEISKIKNNEELIAKKGLDPNDVLYASLKYNKDSNIATQQFAKYFNLDDKIGKIAAQELITAYKIEENCNQKGKSDACPPTEFNPQNIKTLNDSKQADAILFEIATTINYSDEISQFISIIKDNQPLLLKLFDHTKNLAYLSPLTNGIDTPTTILTDAALKTKDGETHPIDQMALDDFILKRYGKNDFEKKSEVQNNLITQLLLNDLNTHAINLANEISKNNIEEYTKSKNTIFNCDRCSEISNELIAYQIDNGNLAAAKKLASQLKIIGTKENKYEMEIRKLLLNMISPKYSRKDLYNLMIHGNLTGKFDKTKDHGECGPYGCGWLSSLSTASPIIKKLAYKFFRQINYPEFARYIKEPNYHST